MPFRLALLLRFGMIALAVLAVGVVLIVSQASADKQDNPPLIRAAQRGNPWINLLDGKQLSSATVGGLGRGKPLALATADFDEDGMPDLVSGYETLTGGVVVLHRGNVDAVYPRVRGSHPGSSQQPFLPQPQVVETPEAPQWLGTGDFDADGHWDLALAAPGSRTVWFLPGNGKGAFREAEEIALPGVVSTLLTAEVNRADGLMDLVVGITGEGHDQDNAKLLVFEGPEGARRAEPEVIRLPGPATAVAVGHLDGDFQLDIAVGAGRELVIVRGRDRRLSLDRPCGSH